MALQVLTKVMETALSVDTAIAISESTGDLSRALDGLKSQREKLLLERSEVEKRVFFLCAELGLDVSIAYKAVGLPTPSLEGTQAVAHLKSHAKADGKPHPTAVAKPVTKTPIAAARALRIAAAKARAVAAGAYDYKKVGRIWTSDMHDKFTIARFSIAPSEEPTPQNIFDALVELFPAVGVNLEVKQVGRHWVDVRAFETRVQARKKLVSGEGEEDNQDQLVGGEKPKEEDQGQVSCEEQAKVEHLVVAEKEQRQGQVSGEEQAKVEHLVVAEKEKKQGQGQVSGEGKAKEDEVTEEM